MRKPLILIVGLVFLLVAPHFAWGQAKVATAGAQFLELGVSARAIGIGEAFLAISDDPSAVYYNPAGLAQIANREAMFTHVSYLADINYDFAGLAYPTTRFGGGIWGVGFYMLNAGDMDATLWEYPYGSGQTFTAKDYALSLSYARNLTDRFSVGTTLKLIDELYDTERAVGWAADMGTLYNTGFRGFKIAMVISNFGPNLKFIRQDYPLPMNFKFGGVLDIVRNEDHKATFSVEGSHPNDNVEKFNAGVEYWFKDMFSLRFGDHFGYDTGGISAGLGFKLTISGKKLNFDYGYHDMGLLEGFHRFSVGISF
jgi:long-subunit fatty acid transport protein